MAHYQTYDYRTATYEIAAPITPLNRYYTPQPAVSVPAKVASPRCTPAPTPVPTGDKPASPKPASPKPASPKPASPKPDEAPKAPTPKPESPKPPTPKPESPKPAKLALPSNEVTEGLKVQATEFLQQTASRYMKSQESILQAMKFTMDSLRNLDEDLQQNIETLQANFKRAQEQLGKKLHAESRQLKEEVEAKKHQLTKRMEKLSELNLEVQKKYFESQDSAISQYKKTMQKALQ